MIEREKKREKDSEREKERARESEEKERASKGERANERKRERASDSKSEKSACSSVFGRYVRENERERACAQERESGRSACASLVSTHFQRHSSRIVQVIAKSCRVWFVIASLRCPLLGALYARACLSVQALYVHARRASEHRAAIQ